jgi:regulator of replication initiation timing
MSKWKRTTGQTPDLSGTQLGDLVSSLTQIKEHLEARIREDKASIQSVRMETERLRSQREKRVRQKEQSDD